MTMDKLFDGSDAHLLGANAELIQRLRTYAAHHNSALLTESADTLEAADKRIAELEQTNCSRLDESERKLAVAREAMKVAADQARKCDYVPCRSTLLAALAQIGGDE